MVYRKNHAESNEHLFVLSVLTVWPPERPKVKRRVNFFSGEWMDRWLFSSSSSFNCRACVRCAVLTRYKLVSGWALLGTPSLWPELLGTVTAADWLSTRIFPAITLWRIGASVCTRVYGLMCT